MAGMQFVVPQFIEVESKIIGPISARQFILLIISLGSMYVWFKLLPPLLFIPAIMLTGVVGGALAFGKVNGQMMHYFLLNLIQTLRRPRLKVWKRTEYVFREPKKEKENVGQLAYSEKAPASESRLAEMSLMVDTGGTYVGDDARLPGAAASVFDPSPSAQQATPLMNGTAPQKRSEDTSKGINLGK